MKKKFLIGLLFIASTISAQKYELVGVPGVLSEVNSIVINPYNENIIYTLVGYKTFLKTTDGGLTAEPIYVDENNTRITDIAIPSEQSIVYGDFNNGYFKSDDQGKTWNIINSDKTPNTKVIKLNPLSSSKYYIKKNTNEFWRSDDGGINWQKVTSFSEEIVEFEIHPLDTSIIYFATISRLYKSTNSGRDWTEQHQLSFIEDIQLNPLDTSVIYTQADNYLYKSTNSGNSPNLIFQDDISTFKLNQVDTNVVYLSNKIFWHGTIGGLHKSIDGGKNWTLLEEINNIVGPCQSEIGCLPPVYSIDISLKNPDVVYIGGLLRKGIFNSEDGGDHWKLTNLTFSYPDNLILDKDNPNFLVAGLFNRGIIKTNDGGINWYTPNFDIEPTKIEPIPRSFDFNPRNKIEGFLASENGLYKTTDGGDNWFRLDDFDVPTFSVYYHKYYPDTIFLNAQNASFLSRDKGNTWDLYETGHPSLYMKFVKTDPTLVYSISLVQHAINTFEYIITKSNDLGENWYEKTNGLSINNETGLFNIISSIEPDVNNPNIVYCGQQGSMSKSIDGGDNWFRIDSSLLEYEPKMNQPKILLDPENPGRIYVGLLGYTDFFTDDYTTGGLFLTEDDCKTWKQVYFRNVRDIFTDEGKPRYIYLSTDYGLMRFLDTLTVTDVIQTKPVLPKKFVLEQNYPNPFNPSTTIKYNLPSNEKRETRNVKLIVYDVLGKEVITLVNKQQKPGNYAVQFDATDLPSGIYFYRLQSGASTSLSADKAGSATNNFVEVKKMMLLK